MQGLKMDKKWIEKKKSEIKSTLHKQLISVDSTETTDDYVIVSGYVNRFMDNEGNIVVDRDGDAVAPFGMDITEYQKNPVILFQHKRDEPIGRAVNIEKREDGIYMVMHIFKDLNQKVYNAVRLGALSAFSIGFKVSDVYYDEEKDIFYLVKTLLLENSIVSVPANQESIIDSVVMSNGTKCLAIHGEDYVSKTETSSEEGKFETIVETVEQLSNSFDTLLDYLGSKGFKEPKESKDVEEELKTEEDPEEDPVVETTSLSYEDVVNFLRENKVTEENFDSLLEVAENLSTELNSFLEENLN